MATSGNRGKFSERIKRIAFRKKNRNIYIDDKDSKLVYTNILKVLAAIPGMVYGSFNVEDVSSNNIHGDKFNLNNINTKKENNVNNLFKINSIDVNSIKKKQSLYYGKNINVLCKDTKKNNGTKGKNQIFNNSIKFNEENKFNKINHVNNMNDGFEAVQKLHLSNSVDGQGIVSVNNETRVKKLEKEILDIIKKKLVLSINNLEILQSELYILSEVNGDVKTSIECQKQINEIKNLLNRIKKLKEQYDFLRDNYDFEYLMALDEDNLIDKIIELKDIFGNNQVVALVEDYKLLEEYKYLYLKIDKLQDKTYEFEEKRQKQYDLLKERNIDFEAFKNKVYNISDTNNLYNRFVNEQNAVISEIDKNILKINSFEQVNYHLKGFNKLLFNSFKYFGLLMLSPLKGVFPAIAAEALITRGMVKNLYRNLNWEEERKIVYEAIDYSSLINATINEMENTSNIIDMTLSDIVRLRTEYNKKFKEYQNDFSEYIDVMHKIDEMENKILGNKIKIEIMKKRALEQKKENNKKLVLVDKLNSNDKK